MLVAESALERSASEQHIFLVQITLQFTVGKLSIERACTRQKGISCRRQAGRVGLVQSAICTFLIILLADQTPYSIGQVGTIFEVCLRAPAKNVHVMWTYLFKNLSIPEIKENYVGSETLPSSIKEKETHWHEEPCVCSTREKEELVRIWRVISRPQLQTKTFKLRATGFFKSGYRCCQFVCIKHRVSMLLKSSLMGFLCIKAELFKIILHDDFKYERYM